MVGGLVFLMCGAFLVEWSQFLFNSGTKEIACWDCHQPRSEKFPTSNAIGLEGSLIDVQTASIEIMTLHGNQQLRQPYVLALWRGPRPGLMGQAMAILSLKEGDMATAFFDQLNLNRNFDHCIGLIVGTKPDSTAIPNVCAALYIPAGICPPDSLAPLNSQVNIKARFVNSLRIKYSTLQLAVDEPQWLAVMEGELSPKPFKLNGKVDTTWLSVNQNMGYISLNQLDLNRLSTYTVLYGVGSIANGGAAIAATSFTTD